MIEINTVVYPLSRSRTTLGTQAHLFTAEANEPALLSQYFFIFYFSLLVFPIFSVHFVLSENVFRFILFYFLLKSCLAETTLKTLKKSLLFVAV